MTPYLRHSWRDLRSISRNRDQKTRPVDFIIRLRVPCRRIRKFQRLSGSMTLETQRFLHGKNNGLGVGVAWGREGWCTFLTIYFNTDEPSCITIVISLGIFFGSSVDFHSYNNGIISRNWVNDPNSVHSAHWRHSEEDNFKSSDIWDVMCHSFLFNIKLK